MVEGSKVVIAEAEVDVDFLTRRGRHPEVDILFGDAAKEKNAASTHAYKLTGDTRGFSVHARLLRWPGAVAELTSDLRGRLVVNGLRVGSVGAESNLEVDWVLGRGLGLGTEAMVRQRVSLDADEGDSIGEPA